MSNVEQKRKYYRLKYPRRARPYVRFSDELFSVTEVSEGGIRVRVGAFNNMYKGLSMKGTLNLHDDSEVSVEGAILRFDEDEVVVKLKKGPSFKDMVEEQRHIRNKYPSFFASLRRQAA